MIFKFDSLNFLKSHLYFQTGEILKKTSLTYSRFDPVTLLVEPITQFFYVAIAGCIKCIHSETHEEIWSSPLKGMGISYGKTLY